MNPAPLAVDSSYIIRCVCVKEAEGHNWGECHLDHTGRFHS